MANSPSNIAGWITVDDIIKRIKIVPGNKDEVRRFVDEQVSCIYKVAASLAVRYTVCASLVLDSIARSQERMMPPETLSNILFLHHC